jgi:hypothetical protein
VRLVSLSDADGSAAALVLPSAVAKKTPAIAARACGHRGRPGEADTDDV